MVDVEPRSDGEEVSRLVSGGENVIRVILSASGIQEKASAVRIERSKKINKRGLANKQNGSRHKISFHDVNFRHLTL